MAVHPPIDTIQQAYHLPRWEELPDMELYMDQVIGLLQRYAAPVLPSDAERTITSSMVNNYVKQHILPPPVKKRYNRTHLACLVVLCLLKPVLSIPEVKQMLDAQLSGDIPHASAYDAFCAAQESALAEAARRCIAQEKVSSSRTALALEMAVQASACKAITQKLLLTASQKDMPEGT